MASDAKPATDEQVARWRQPTSDIFLRMSREPERFIAPLIARIEAEVERREHYKTKATCYGNMVHNSAPALEAAGFPVDGGLEGGAVEGIKRAVEALVANREAEKARARDWERSARSYERKLDAVWDVIPETVSRAHSLVQAVALAVALAIRDEKARADEAVANHKAYVRNAVIKHAEDEDRIAALERELAEERDECLRRIQERDSIMRAVLGDDQPAKERTVKRAVERIVDARGLVAEALALTPTVSGDMEKVRVWSDVVARLRRFAKGASDGE